MPKREKSIEEQIKEETAMLIDSFCGGNISGPMDAKTLFILTAKI